MERFAGEAPTSRVRSILAAGTRRAAQRESYAVHTKIKDCKSCIGRKFTRRVPQDAELFQEEVLSNVIGDVQPKGSENAVGFRAPSLSPEDRKLDLVRQGGILITV